MVCGSAINHFGLPDRAIRSFTSFFSIPSNSAEFFALNLEAVCIFLELLFREKKNGYEQQNTGDQDS